MFYQKLFKLRFLFRLGSGDENIDHLTLNKMKIKYMKSQITPYRAVAELIIGMILILYRKIIDQHANLIKKGWNKQMGNLLFGKQLVLLDLVKLENTYHI